MRLASPCLTADLLVRVRSALCSNPDMDRDIAWYTGMDKKGLIISFSQQIGGFFGDDNGHNFGH